MITSYKQVYVGGDKNQRRNRRFTVRSLKEKKNCVCMVRGLRLRVIVVFHISSIVLVGLRPALCRKISELITSEFLAFWHRYYNTAVFILLYRVKLTTY